MGALEDPPSDFSPPTESFVFPLQAAKEMMSKDGRTSESIFLNIAFPPLIINCHFKYGRLNIFVSNPLILLGFDNVHKCIILACSCQFYKESIGILEITFMF